MELDLKDRSINFSVLNIDGYQVVSWESFDERFPTENSAFSDFMEDYIPSDGKVDVEYTYYNIGNGESQNANDDELDYIAEHLNEVIEDADILEGGNYKIDISFLYE